MTLTLFNNAIVLKCKDFQIFATSYKASLFKIQRIQDGRYWVDDVWGAEEQLCFKYRILRDFLQGTAMTGAVMRGE